MVSIKVVQSYDIDRTDDIVILDNDINWKKIGENAIQELKCRSPSKSKNRVAVLVKYNEYFEKSQCESFTGLSCDYLNLNSKHVPIRRKFVESDKIYSN